MNAERRVAAAAVCAVAESPALTESTSGEDGDGRTDADAGVAWPVAERDGHR